MQSQNPSHAVADFESLLFPFVQSLALDTALLAQKSLLSLLSLIGSLLDHCNTSMDIIGKYQRFPVAELFKVKERAEENKDASETEENDYSEGDEDDRDTDEDDDSEEENDDGEDDSDDEDSDENEDRSDDEDDSNDEDDEDEDDEDSDSNSSDSEDEDEDEEPQPPSKKKK